MSQSGELKRKLVHVSMVGFALCIGRLAPPFIVAATATALVFNIFLLPRITGRALERSEDRDRGFSLGMIAYPAVLLVLSLVFYNRQVFVAVGWGAMAFGDGFAGLVGRALKGPRIPWAPAKSLWGTLAFCVLGTLGTCGLLALLPESALLGVAPARWAAAVAGAVCVAALMETVPGLVDDNLVVAPTAACVALFLLASGLPALPTDWAHGLVWVGLLAVASIGSRKIDVPGGLCGALIAWLIFLGGGLPALLLLALFFLVGSLASMWKKGEKDRLGVAQAREGQRSVPHALANGGVAAVCGLTAWCFPQYGPVFVTALAASLASAAADTVSSELGTVYGTRFVNVLTFQPDQRGLDGVVSLQGTLLGMVGAALIAVVYGLGPGGATAAVVAGSAGVLGNYADSVLGATLQRRGLMNNHTVNAANTAVAALVAGVVMAIIGAA